MRTAKAVIALLVSASLTAPASAQVVAAVSAAGAEGALPRVSLAVPLAPAAALTAAPVGLLTAAPSVFAAPAPALAAAQSPAAAASAVAPAAAAAPAPAALPAAAAAPAAEAASQLVSPSAVLAAAPVAVPAGRGEAAAPVAAASARGSWERFWSGSSRRESAAEPVAAEAASESGAASLAPSRPAAPTRATAAAAILVPAAHGASSLLSHAAPYAEAAALLAGAYVVTRGARALIGRLAPRYHLDAQQAAAIRLVVNVATWTGAGAGALMLAGASPQTMTAVFGAGGTIVTLGLRDVLGNVIQGVNFLMARPFTIGERVQIDDQVGTIADATLTMILIKKDDGTEVKIRHATLGAKPVIVFGSYQPEKALRLALPSKPKFHGAAGAVLKSLDRRFWTAAAIFAALLAAPPFVPFLAAGWAAAGVHWALIGSIAWLTHRVELALIAAVDRLAAENAWRQETTVVTRLAVRAAVWLLGGGSALRLIGVSWTALGAGAGLTTLGLGLASNNFFGSVIQGGEVLFTKPFKIGDRVKIGVFEGLVEDMTLNHVVIRLDEGRHALVPYAVVRDATLVVTPGK
jgi:small-conductance mechanosensitive channel